MGGITSEKSLNGQRAGDYVLQQHVADGAMGAVYRARRVSADSAGHDPVADVGPPGVQPSQAPADPGFDDVWAVKVLHPRWAADPVACERFFREFETMQSLDHPAIVRACAVGKLELGAVEGQDSRPYIVMEWVEGRSLDQHLAALGRLEAAAALQLSAQIASALAHAHARGIIHRDLKPENILILAREAGWRIKLLDFGAVKRQLEFGPRLTAAGTTLGSPYYMAPEQAMGKRDLDVRVDVFALGVLSYELLSARLPFEGTDVASVLTQILGGSRIPISSLGLGLPWSLDDVFQRALARQPEARYPDVVALVQALLTACGLRSDLETWATQPLSEARAQWQAARAQQPSNQVAAAAAIDVDGPAATTQGRGPVATDGLAATGAVPAADASVRGGAGQRRALLWVAAIVLAAALAIVLWSRCSPAS
ncbi:MAG: serine/threonine-protein kinase [Polyangiales bacterium]